MELRLYTNRAMIMAILAIHNQFGRLSSKWFETMHGAITQPQRYIRR